mgnify:CR=1 FL=1
MYPTPTIRWELAHSVGPWSNLPTRLLAAAAVQTSWTSRLAFPNTETLSCIVCVTAVLMPVYHTSIHVCVCSDLVSTHRCVSVSVVLSFSEVSCVTAPFIVFKTSFVLVENVYPPNTSLLSLVILVVKQRQWLQLSKFVPTAWSPKLHVKLSHSISRGDSWQSCAP